MNYKYFHNNALPRVTKYTTSLCIPRMDASISRDYIYNIFNILNVGHIEYINEIPLRNEADYKRIIIRIRFNTSDKANVMKEFLDTRGYFNIVHDMPWFWRVLKGNQ